MKRTGTILIITLLICITGSLSSCKQYLDEPSSRSLVIPKTLDDLQAILNGAGGAGGCQLLDGLSDDYYTRTTTWQTVYSNSSLRTSNDALHYIWSGEAVPLDDYWRNSYYVVYKANVVIDALSTVGPRNEKWNNIKGTALFLRSFSFWSIAQTYCKPYSTSAQTDMGIPLRLNANPEETSTRASVQATYDQIINDFKTASELLPETVTTATLPNKAAAYAGLARTYLSMRDYANAKKYSDSVLIRTYALLDYNTVNASATVPIPLINPEIIYWDQPNSPVFSFTGSATSTFIDTFLYASYDNNDLRKTVFFKPNGNGGYSFQGSYGGGLGGSARRCFDGYTTDECYLIRAECNARSGNIMEAMSDLNTLMKKRWKSTVPYVNITATDPADALNKVLNERRKELVFRGMRWPDMRRLNLEGRNIIPTRVVNGTTYTLPLSSPKWVVLIPQDVINYSGMPQNPR